jgi:hypothetical protein
VLLSITCWRAGPVRPSLRRRRRPTLREPSRALRLVDAIQPRHRHRHRHLDAPIPSLSRSQRSIADGAAAARFQLSQPPHVQRVAVLFPFGTPASASSPPRPLSVKSPQSLARCSMHGSKNSSSVRADRFGACTRPRAACFTLHVDTLIPPLDCSVPSRPGPGNSMRSCFSMS